MVINNLLSGKMNWLELKEALLQSVDKLIILVLIVFATFVISRIINMLLRRAFDKASKHLKIEPTKFNFFRHVLNAIIVLIGISISVYTIPALRAVSVSLLAGAGVLAVVIGFASQQAFANIVAGIFIVIFKPFKVGERIKINADAVGMVEDITLRHTVIKNFENKRIIIPNSVISNAQIENWDAEDKKICKHVDFGISYDSDINLAISIIQDEAEKHENCIDNRDKDEKKNNDPIVRVRVMSFGDSSVNLRAWIWAESPPQAFVIGTDLNKSIKERFDREGVEIPFPYRTIVYKKDVPKNAKLKQKKQVKKSSKKTKKNKVGKKKK